jgi:hypothetical protein
MIQHHYDTGSLEATNIDDASQREFANRRTKILTLLYTLSFCRKNIDSL